MSLILASGSGLVHSRESSVSSGNDICLPPRSNLLRRWLVAKGRDGEAIAVLAKYHANNRERDPLVYFTYGQIREALSIERDVSKSSSYVTLFKTVGNRRRMRIVLAIGFFSQWSGNGLVSYYVSNLYYVLVCTSAHMDPDW